MSNTDKTFSKRKEASLLPTLPSPALLLEATIPIIYIRKIQAGRNRRLRKMHVFSNNLGSFTRKGRPKYPGDLSPTSIPKLDLLR